MIKRVESSQVEFKQSVCAGAIKTIIAFANTEGGDLYIGVEDDGEIIGICNLDEELTRLSNMMHDSIRPDILMNCSIRPESIDGKSVILVHVERGTKRPYYLAAKGPRPEGVFIRSGAATLPSSESGILHMIQQSEQDTFESRPSLLQDLTFGYASEKFSRKNLSFGANELRTLGARTATGSYTNLGLLLSDQCPSTIKAALFSDAERTAFTFREEYSGSILKQLADAYSFLERNNHYKMSFDGLERIDHHDIPPVALREALINSVAHREYALSGPTLISVMPNKVEIVSLGGLPLGIGYSDLSAHISMPRNKLLSNVFFRLELIEAYGTGIERMRNSYNDSGTQPTIRITPNTFTVELPNRNAPHPKLTNEADSDAEVRSILGDGKARSRKEIQNELGVSQSTAIRLLKELETQGHVKRVGSGKNTRYAITR